ncbi:cephalosporin hydroxylase family protein [Silvimonas amylolytica]|uniref:Cephalosporin hydroxylase n=1 Tax=Silvimonas amylolytica TaxID=449663 RepID=A0ABQ2PH29_9NEIS|nr:cephalosporin hydroxylase family protein [Silvimonas amylolytica]GGP24601.1 cephalosporin hydroxylase [Silvimonas amylolytica]
MTDDMYARFEAERVQDIAAQGADAKLKKMGVDFVVQTAPHKYTYNFKALGRPIIQLPQDMVAMQELIWQLRPDLIIETGIAHGGSLIMSASMLALLDYCDAVEQGVPLDPKASKRTVLGLDIDIREHNRAAIEAHPLAHKIEMIQGSSIDPQVIAQVHARARGCERVLVCLDSNHTHAHVLAELEAYAPLTTPGSYCVVFDTVVEDMPADAFPDRPWGVGDNPKTAVHQWLKNNPEFEIDHTIENKLLITVAPDGYLKRIA